MRDRQSRRHRLNLQLPLLIVASMMLWAVPGPVANAGTDSDSYSPGPSAKHGWVPYHWTKPKDGPRKIKFLNSLTGSWANELPKSMDDWDKAKKYEFSRKSASTGGEARKKCNLPKKYGQVHVCNYKYNWGDAARGTIKPNPEGNITKGVIELNDDVINASRLSVLCHEIGHTLGLDHRVEKSSCLYNGVDKFPPDPDNHDIDRLNSQTETARPQTTARSGGHVRPGCTPSTCVHFSRTKSGGTKIVFRLLAIPASLNFYKLV